MHEHTRCGYVVMHMVVSEHAYNMHVNLLLSVIGCKIW
jgi:hypothetical protein